MWTQLIAYAFEGVSSSDAKYHVRFFGLTFSHSFALFSNDVVFALISIFTEGEKGAPLTLGNMKSRLVITKHFILHPKVPVNKTNL